jgi:membrane fusion protein (multidrug efflux system)
MTSPSFALRLAPFLIAVLAAACTEETGQAQFGVPEVNVVTLKPQAVTLTRELPGRTRPFAIAEVRPQVTGIIRERLFTEGSDVKAGDPLYQLDDAIYRATFNSARASLARAEALVDVARLNARRAEELIKSKAISEQEYQNLLARRSETEADVDVAKAQLASAKVQLEYARIRSPIAGIAGRSSVTEGALVTADQPSLLTTVQQLDPIYVDVTQSSSELLKLRRQVSESALREAQKLPVAILLEDGEQYAYEGELAFSEVAVDPATGGVALRIVVPNPDHILLPGMYVRALITTAVLEDGILVPQQGIARDAKGDASAMVVNGDGVVERRPVVVSDTFEGNWLVKDGLHPGDRVVVAGLQKIAPGAEVHVTDITGD